MSITLTVDSKLLGQRRPLFTGWAVHLPPETSHSLRLRDLITRVVQEEVEAFKQRQADRRLARILSNEQIEQGVTRGKVELGERDLKQDVDAASAVTTALQAFEDGLYFVFVEGEQVTTLDSEVMLLPETRVTFLRLVALAGG